MGKWFRCPICNKFSLERNIGNDYPIKVFNQVGLGRAKGWRYDPIPGLDIVARIKDRIRVLYERFFIIPDISINVPISRVFLPSDPIMKLNPSIPILVKTEV
ncbi:unnamed protein product, partial [marine sediment metagenome]